MTEEARVLTRELLRRHENVCRKFTVTAAEDVNETMVKGSVISYGMLCTLAGVPFLTRGVGPFLAEVWDWCNESGWPQLNALAVNGETGIPGDGYYQVELWPDEVRKCIAFRGYPASASM
jgi:alkylated DNA nucleotide flippase Atl1